MLTEAGFGSFVYQLAWTHLRFDGHTTSHFVYLDSKGSRIFLVLSGPRHEREVFLEVHQVKS